MDKDFVQVLEKVREYLFKYGVNDITLEKVNDFGISTEEVSKFVGSVEELVDKLLEYERKCFEEIFEKNNFDGLNAIDILLYVSQEINDRFYNVSPSITLELEKYFPEEFGKHIDARMNFIYEKIQVNIEKGITQKMYRDDLSSEMVGRMYLSKLEEIHNPELYPPERFKFGTIFDTMIDDFVKGIATGDGLRYYRHRKQLLGVLSFGR